MTQLSEHFSQDEFQASPTAKARGIANVMPSLMVNAAKALCVEILEPIRLHFGGPIKINSGYRCRALNQAVGSRPGSQHEMGQAADFEIPGVSNLEVARWVRDNLQFDQLILENHREGDPNSGWVHCSLSSDRHRHSVLTMTMGSHGPVYSAGLPG
jgi:zinc D-Ala-D-Ala carboxypeptidase